MYTTMSTVYVLLFFLHFSRAACLRASFGPQVTGFVAFMSPSAVTCASRLECRGSFRRGAEPVSSSYEPLPYSSGYVPTIASGDLKYMGQPLEGAFKPANNYVLILKTEAHQYSEGGVYIGGKPNKEFAGRVLAVGPGKYATFTGTLIPMSVKVGDIVLYDPPEEETVLTYKNQGCVLVPEDQIYARVECDLSQPRTLEAADIRPLSDRILVRIIDSPKKTQSGLVLARSDDVGETIYRATVVCPGPGSYREDGSMVPLVGFQAGDTVLFSDTAADGGEFSVSRAQHAFVRQSAILAKV